jgi:hypothetical protein
LPRIAGDNPGYQFRMMRNGLGGKLTATPYGFELPSVTTIISATIAKPFSAGAWYGYRMGLEAVTEEYRGRSLPANAEMLEKRLSESGRNPNQQLDVSRNRGFSAHDVLELLANGDEERANEVARSEESTSSTAYGRAVLKWWAEKGKGVKWKAEQPVYSLKHGYAGTADLISATEVVDLKTHKPMVGFTKDGKGPAYLSDLIQLRAYRLAWSEMGNPAPQGNRIVIARPNGNYLEDYREVPESLWLQCIEMYKHLEEVK